MPHHAESFDAARLDLHWTPSTPGGATLHLADSALWLTLPSARRGAYSDAQIDDYSGRSAARYPWRPPLRMEVRARASHPAEMPAISPSDTSGTDAPQRFLRGTAGFGFWNCPLTRAGGVPRLPDAVWFFYASPPSNMALVPGVPGYGWKAQVVHAHRLSSILTSIPTLGSIAYARLSGHDAPAVRWVHRLTGASEFLLDIDLTAWHDYALEWHPDAARFSIDGAEVLVAPDPPPGSLGFVAWIDNQYAVATPRGSLRFGTLASEREWLALDALSITPL
jgi:hypothetical protein